MSDMERKIGEIFKYNDKWYQCLKSPDGSCKHCDMNFGGKCHIPIKECVARSRSDLSYVIFKKLEKVGEPYEFNGHIFQAYHTFEVPIFTENYATVREYGNNSKISIEIKQSKEDMEKKKLNLKPFDLKAAKAGKPVYTRNGNRARIICFDRKYGADSLIVALVTIDDIEYTYSYDTDGLFISGKESGVDLMMLPEKKEGWINLWQHESGTVHPDGNIYSSKEEAVKIGSRDYNYVDTVKIEWEE